MEKSPCLIIPLGQPCATHTSFTSSLRDTFTYNPIAYMHTHMSHIAFTHSHMHTLTPANTGTDPYSYQTKFTQISVPNASNPWRGIFISQDSMAKRLKKNRPLYEGNTKISLVMFQWIDWPDLMSSTEVRMWNNFLRGTSSVRASARLYTVFRSFLFMYLKDPLKFQCLRQMGWAM